MFGIDALKISPGQISGTMDGLFGVLQIILLLAVTLGLGWYISFRLQFKHKFRVREVVNGRKIIIDDKARELKTKEGVKFWQLLKKAEKIAVPPPQAIDVDFRGKKCVEAYRTQEGEFIYAQDVAKIMDIPDEIKSMGPSTKKAELLAKWKKDNTIIDAFQPYSTNQRQILINEHRKALDKRSKKWQDYVLPIAGMAALTILVVSLMIFYGDIAKPVLDMADKQKAYAQMHGEHLKIMKEIKLNIQTISNEINTKEDNSELGEPPN